MAATPQFSYLPRVAVGLLTTANANYDGTGTPVTVMTAAGALGTKITRVIVQCTATSAAAVVRLFLHDGTNARLFKEIAVAAATGSSTVLQNQTETTFDDLILPIVSGVAWSLRATTSVTQNMNVVAYGGDL